MQAKSRVSLRGLRTFCVAARHESFRLAGESLFVTASAVSHQIKSLEEELGLRLFDRNGRDLSLTVDGANLYEEVSPLIERLEDVTARYKGGSRSTSIRISVQPFFASEYFVPRLSEFTSAHPDIDIQVGTSDETAEKHPNDADLSIRLFKTAPQSLPSHKLFPLRMVPAGSPGFRKQLEVADDAILSDFPLIVHESRPKAWSQWSTNCGIELPSNSKITRLDSMIAVVRAAERGIGAALVPIPLANLWFEQGSIVRLFEQELVAEVSYFVVCNKARAEDPQVQALLSWILQEFSQEG